MAVTDHREVEDKYDAPRDAALPPLGELPGVASLDEPVESRLEATYFDTVSLRLLAAGITLRRRTGGEDAGWHLKLPAAGARHEIQEPPGTTAVPMRFVETLRVVTRGEPLVPVATIRTDRTAHRLRDAEGRLLAEVADDRVDARQEPRGSRPAREAGAWREWEVELAGGDHTLLARAADLVREAGARPADTTSKLARALADVLPGPPGIPPRSGKDPASAVVHARLLEQVEELRRRDPAVREDLPDGVHKMRVAIRRLRSALATFRPFVDRAVTEPVREELKWLAEVLAPARDAEVQAARLAEDLASQQAGPATTTAHARVEARLGEDYADAHDRVLQALGSDRYADLLGRLDDLVASPPWSQRAVDPIDTALTARIRHDWKRVERRVAAAGDADGAERARLLHEVRKAVKRVRYAVEAVAPVHGSDADNLVEALKQVQDVLGDHHDSVLARARLVDLSAEAAADGESGLPYGVAHAAESDAAADLDAAFEELWAAASKKSRRSWLS